MITFWVIAVVLMLLAIAILLFPFYSKKDIDQQEVDRKQLNIDIAKERLAELDTELAEGVIDQDIYQSMKEELESALYYDIESNTEVNKASQSKGAWITVVIALLVPLISVALYFSLGEPEALTIKPGQVIAQHSREGHDSKPQSIKEMVQKLVARLKKDPEDIDGWFMMGRTLMTLKQYKEAIIAYRKVIELAGKEPGTLVSLADAIAMSRGGDLQGEPEALIAEALEMDPQNITGLWLAGMSAERKQQHRKAIDYWQKLMPLLAADDPSRSTLQGLIAKAQQALGGKGEVVAQKQVPVAKTGLKVHISISPELKAKTTGNELLFVYAKAMSGPPMPLAAVRKQVRDLPLTLTLDDSMAMMPQMKLSNFNKVIVGARVSKSGRPIAQSGDFQGEVSNVMVKGNSDTINVVISQVKP